MTVKQATAAMAKALRDDEAKAARLLRIMERAAACGAKRYAAALAEDLKQQEKR